MTKTTTYSYSTKWSADLIDSSTFGQKSSDSYKDNCDIGKENPKAYPSGMPSRTPQKADKALIGAFSVPKGSAYLDRIELEKSLEAASTPPGWNWTGAEYVRQITQGRDTIGDVRLTFKGNDWAYPQYTVLGLNNDGAISKWTASDSWLCSGFTLAELRRGEKSKDKLFADLEASAGALTWILRIFLWLLMWFACCCIFKPLEVAAECIPFVGEYIGDAIQFMVACITCPVACGCSCGVAGVVWIVMRPAA